MTMKEFKKYLDRAIQQKQKDYNIIRVICNPYDPFLIRELAKLEELIDIRKVVNL